MFCNIFHERKSVKHFEKCHESHLPPTLIQYHDVVVTEGDDKQENGQSSEKALLRRHARN